MIFFQGNSEEQEKHIIQLAGGGFSSCLHAVRELNWR